MKNIKDREDIEERTGQPKIPKICLRRIYPVLLACLMGFQTACAQTGDNINHEYINTDEGGLAEREMRERQLLAYYLEWSYVPHELNLWMAGGFSSPDYRLNTGKANAGTGYAAGIGYTRYISRNWGVSTGLEYAFYRGNISIRNVKTSYATHDADGNPIEYRSLVDSYREYQRSGLLNIPLSIIYRTEKNNRYYASLGFKLGIPVYGRYTGSGSTVTTSGYYPDYYQEEIWQDDLGYGTFPVRTMEKPLKMGLSYTGTLEAGMKWNIGIGTDLYTGVYMDYGLNNVVRGEEKNKKGYFVGYNYDNPAEPSINGLLSSAYGTPGNRQAFMEKVSPLVIGIKLKLAFAIGCGDLQAERRKFREMQTRDSWDNIYDYPVRDTDINTEDSPGQEQTPDTGIHPATVPVESAAPVVNTVNDTEEATGKIQNEAVQSRTGTVITDTAVEIKGTGTKGCNCGPGLPPVITIDNYKPGQTSMSPEQKAMLDKYIVLLQENPQTQINITGHTCNTGTKEGNIRIGQKRADKAKDYLISKGIPPKRISTSGKGEEEPAGPNDTEANRKHNRRLEIRISE